MFSIFLIENALEEKNSMKVKKLFNVLRSNLLFSTYLIDIAKHVQVITSLKRKFSFGIVIGRVQHWIIAILSNKDRELVFHIGCLIQLTANKNVAV